VVTLVGPQAGVDARGRRRERSNDHARERPPLRRSTFAFNGTFAIDGFAFAGGSSGTQGCIFTSVGPNNGMQILNNRFGGYSTAAL